MKAFLIAIGGMMLASMLISIVWATFFAPHPRQPRSFVTVNAATKQGQDPWMVNEKHNVGLRDRSRQNVIKTLERPWAEFCKPDGRKRLIAVVNGYYSGREGQAWSYGNTYGDEARRYALSQWQTADDNRIQRLMSEIYGRGYFSLNELQSIARKPVADLTKGINVYPDPCES